ncbi:unnamed protein product [Urochloa humidicola]
MVLIELEPEPEEATRPSPPAPEEQEAAVEAGLPSSPLAPEEAAAAAGGEAPRAVEEEEEEEAFEDALTDEQLREKARSQANDAKAEGNKLFGAGQYEEALSQYEVALHIASELESAEDIRSACHSNRAVCFLKLGKHDETIKECTKALELNPSYLKALLRRAEAHEKLEHYDEAIAAKLKDLGNSVLGRFGMSVDNFKAVQDPNTGSYSIQFQK